MKYIVSGSKRECEIFDTKQDAGEYLKNQGYGQSDDFDLRDFSEEELFDSVKSQRISHSWYWYAEEVEDQKADERFSEIQEAAE